MERPKKLLEIQVRVVLASRPPTTPMPNIQDALKWMAEELKARLPRPSTSRVEAKASTSKTDRFDLDNWVKQMKDQVEAMKEAYLSQVTSKSEVQRALNTLTIEYAKVLEKQKDQSEVMEQLQVAYT